MIKISELCIWPETFNSALNTDNVLTDPYHLYFRLIEQQQADWRKYSQSQKRVDRTADLSYVFKNYPTLKQVSFKSAGKLDLEI